MIDIRLAAGNTVKEVHIGIYPCSLRVSGTLLKKYKKKLKLLPLTKWIRIRYSSYSG